MTYRSSVTPGLLGWFAAAGLLASVGPSLAQVPPPPLPSEEDAEEEADSDPFGEDEAEEGEEDEEDEPAPAEEPPPPPPAEPWEEPVAAAVPLAPPVDDTTDEEAEARQWFRTMSLRRQTTLSGSTGLLRVKEAGSGLPGTFRINLVGGFFSGKGFLCRDGAVCTDPVTGEDLGEDSARKSDAIVTISATPFSFLEAFMSIRNSATSNSNGSPGLLQVVGDTNFGLKGFMPEKPDQIFSAGGEIDLYLLTGTGGVGVAGSATSFAMRGLATLNLNNRTKEEDRIPLRFHANLGYFFDNSAKVVEALEATPPPAGRGAPVERTERFGLGLSRVDAFEMGVAAEYINPWFRPYLEWTFDIPVNRQAYVCNIQDAEARGDLCLGAEAGFGTTPSRLTLGSRVFPWQASGLSLTLAADIGTGGTKRFLEETTPETPYTLWFGLGYAVDVVPPEPKVVAAAPSLAGPSEVRRYVLGAVVEETSGAAVPDAIIRYDGVPMTGLVADETGQFITQDLPPGEYTFNVFADQFKPGTCSVVIPETAPPAPPTAETQATEPLEEGTFGDVEEAQTEESELPAESGLATEGAFLDQDGNLLVPLTCKLKELPQVANVTGVVVDAASGGAVVDATVTITDKLNRSLKLSVDETGSFQFRNVPFGTSHLKASASGYLTTLTPIIIDGRQEMKPHVLMNPRPKKLAVTLGRKEIVLGRSIEFVAGKEQVAVSSMSILEELTAALAENPDVSGIEIQVHTDDSGSASLNRTLSQKRADEIKDLLTRLGVQKDRLTGKGYGPDQPLAPNVTEANRARNNRVQFIITSGESEASF